MGPVGEQVDDGHVDGGGHGLEGGVVADACAEDRAVPGEGPGDVLDGLAGAHADLVLAEVDRVGPEGGGGHLGRRPGAGRRFLENHGDALAGQAGRDPLGRVLPGLGALEQRGEGGGVEVVDLEEVGGAGHEAG